MAAGRNCSVSYLFPEQPSARPPSDAQKQHAGAMGELIEMPFLPAAERKLGHELDALEPWVGDDPRVKRVEVLLAENSGTPQLEVVCRRRALADPDPLIMSAMPKNVEIAGRRDREGKRRLIKCALRWIRIGGKSISLFLIIAPAYEVIYRTGDFRAMPAVQSVFIDLPGSRRIELRNAHFNPKWGDICPPPRTR